MLIANIHVVAPVLCPAHNVWCGHVCWCGADSPIIIILSSALMQAAHNPHDFCFFSLPSQVLLPYIKDSKQANSFKDADIDRAIIGLARTIYIRFIYTMFLAGKTPNIRSYTVFIYGSGQPYYRALCVGWQKHQEVRCRRTRLRSKRSVGGLGYCVIVKYYLE